MNTNEYVNLQLYYRSKYDNRNIVAAICINELLELIEIAENIYDILKLNQLIYFLRGQIDKDTL